MNLMILGIAFWVCAVSNGESVANSDLEANRLIDLGKSLNSPILKLLGRTFEKLEKAVQKDIEILEKDVLKDIDNKTTFVLGQVNKSNSSLEQRLILERKELTDIIGRTFEKLEKDLRNIDNKTTFVLEQVNKDSSSLEQRLVSEIGQVNKDRSSLEQRLVSEIGQVNKDRSSLEQRLVSEIGQVNKDRISLEQRLVSERRELIDIICQLHPCTEWEAWTGCSAKTKATFGAQTRSRKCGVKASKLCSSTGQEQKETDSRICEGRTPCPSNYTLTTNGYCMGVHSRGKQWTSAQAVCKQDGGYLINIDSEVKNSDVNNTLNKMALTNAFWIDGTRTLPSQNWLYEYGPQDAAYSNWRFSRESVNGYGCKYYTNFSNSIWYVRAGSCSNIYQFICEIV